MINNTTAKSTYVIADGVYTYTIGFLYDYNPDNTPQIKVYLNKQSGSPLVYGTDYTISQDGLSIVLVTITAGDRLDIIRNIPLVQLSDYVIGRIDPEQIEDDFDKSVMRDQQLKGDIDFIGEVPIDHENRIQTLEQDVDGIEDLIPAQTTASNQLADKDFVNSSIATSTATFRGTYSSLAELEEVTADDNDYGFVESVDAVGNTLYSRYKYSNGSWVFEYNLNNSSFTAAQWAAINSGITAGIVGTFDATGHNVGDIFFTMRPDNDLNGAVECDGATYQTTDFTGAQSIGALLEAHKVAYVSLSEYEWYLQNDGSVGKFGWDGTGTTAFRVPKLDTNIFVQSIKPQQADLGGIYQPGLPNIKATNGTNITDTGVPTGAFVRGNLMATNGGGQGQIYEMGFDASRSSSVYKNNVSTVQPYAVRYRLMVQLAIKATDEALETCTGVLADVANLKTNKSGCCSFNTNTRVAITNTNQTATKNGWLVGPLYFSGTNTYLAVIVNDIEIVHSPWSDGGVWSACNVQIPIKQGQTFRYDGNGTMEQNHMYFYPDD